MAEGARAQRESNRARILTGHCWNYPRAQRTDTNYHDIKIGDFEISWNLDAGDIPCERHGKGHRRARLSDVLTYKEKRSARATELARMREAAADGSLYDLDLSDQMFAQFVNAP